MQTQLFQDGMAGNIGMLMNTAMKFFAQCDDTVTSFSLIITPYRVSQEGA